MDKVAFHDESKDKKWIICKVCGHEVEATKIIMHVKRSTKGCKEGYGKDFDAMIAKRDEDRKLYLKNYDKTYKKLNSDALNKKRRESYKKKSVKTKWHVKTKTREWILGILKLRQQNFLYFDPIFESLQMQAESCRT